MWLKSLLDNLVFKLRGEYLQIDDFGNKDLFRIFISRFLMLTRGGFRINIFSLKRGLYFIGRNVSISGLEKIKFGKTITIGNNVKISTIGAVSFTIGDNFTIRDC